MLLSLAGCAFGAAVLRIQLTHGDYFKVKMISNYRDLTLKFDKDDNNLLKLYDDADVVLLCAFQTHESLGDYLEIVISELESNGGVVKIEESGEVNGVKYTLISFENENGYRTYEIIGWIVGTNTGIIADGEFKNETLKLFGTLKFKISRTEQTNADYYFKNIDNFENLMD